MTKTSQTTTQAGETIVVIGMYYWGKGETLAEAKANFRKQGGVLSNGYTIYTFDAETEFIGVDDMARFHYKRTDGKDERPNPPTEQIIQPKK